MLVLLLNACFNKKNTNTVGLFCPDSKEISKIIVNDKTIIKPFLQQIVVTDANQIALFCNQINRLKKIEGRINTKSTMGFWEVNLIMADETHSSLLVTRTVYDGVTIYYNNKNYKNDDMDFLIVHWFAEGTH